LIRCAGTISLPVCDTKSFLGCIRCSGAQRRRGHPRPLISLLAGLKQGIREPRVSIGEYRIVTLFFVLRHKECRSVRFQIILFAERRKPVVVKVLPDEVPCYGDPAVLQIARIVMAENDIGRIYAVYLYEYVLRISRSFSVVHKKLSIVAEQQVSLFHYEDARLHRALKMRAIRRLRYAVVFSKGAKKERYPCL